MSIQKGTSAIAAMLRGMSSLLILLLSKALTSQCGRFLTVSLKLTTTLYGWLGWTAKLYGRGKIPPAPQANKDVRLASVKGQRKRAVANRLRQILNSCGN